MFSILRLIRAFYVLTRYGVMARLLKSIPNTPSFLKFLAKAFASKKKIKNHEIIKSIDKLGPSYIKLAQFLATRPDIVGTEISDKLGLLQDRLEPFTKQQAIKQIAKSLNISEATVEKQFLLFSEPIAAASIAQVHKAQWADETGFVHNLAIKVIRPNVKERFASDIKSFYGFARLAEKISSKARRLRFVSIVEELDNTTRKEMDMRLEASAISEMTDNIVLDKNFRVPKIYWKLTGRDCLAMEWIDGIKIANKDGLKEAGFNLKNIAQNLMQAFLCHSLRDGYFHADMHPGNLFIDKYENIVAVDFGITGRLSTKERFFLAQILYGFLTRDYMLVSQAHFDAGYVPKHHKVEDFAQATRAIGDPIHGQKAKDISMANLLTLLFEVTEIFDMQSQPELIFLQKNMVIVEGVARDLDPNFNMWEVAKPIVEEWMKQNMGFKNIAAQIHKSGKPLLNILHNMPDLLNHWRDNHLNNSNTPTLHLIPQAINSVTKYIFITQLSLVSLAITLIYIAFRGFH